MSAILRFTASFCVFFLWSHLFVWPIGMIFSAWDLLPKLPIDRIITTDFLLCVLASAFIIVWSLFWKEKNSWELLRSAQRKIKYLEAHLTRLGVDREDLIQKGWDY